MVIVLAILGFFVGAGMGSSAGGMELVGAVIGCIAGAWLGRWLKKTKPVPPEAHAAVRTDLPAPDAAADRDRQSLDERVRSLALRVSHLETEVVRLGGSVAQATVAEPVLRVE